MTMQLTLGIPDEIADELRKLAVEKGRPVDQLALEAIERMIEDALDYRLAHERFTTMQETVPIEEVMKRFGVDD